MGLWNSIKEKCNRPLLRTILIVTGACVAGNMAGLVGVAAVLGGAFVYGVSTEYVSRKKNATNEAIEMNGGRPLSEKQKTLARQKALVDTLGIGGMVGIHLQPQTLDEAKRTYTGSNRGKKTSEQTPKTYTMEEPDFVRFLKGYTSQGAHNNTEATKQPKVVETKAFDFGNFIGNQGGRKS